MAAVTWVTAASPLRLAYAMLDDESRDVDAGGRHRVAELHRVVDLVDRPPALGVGVLHEVEGKAPAAHGAGRAQAQLVQLGRHLGHRRGAATRGVGAVSYTHLRAH